MRQHSVLVSRGQAVQPIVCTNTGSKTHPDPQLDAHGYLQAGRAAIAVLAAAGDLPLTCTCSAACQGVHADVLHGSARISQMQPA